MDMEIPSDLKLINSKRSPASLVNRQTKTLFCTGDSTIESGRGNVATNYIEFKIPVVPRRSWDLSTMCVHFNFRIVLNGVTKAAGTNTTRIHVHDSIESIVREITVDLGNGQRLEEIRNGYNSLESALNFYVSSDYVKGFLAPCTRGGLHSHVRNRIYHKFENATTLTTSGSETSNQFSMPLRLLGVSSPDVIIPSQLFGGSGSFLTIQLFLESPSNCIVAGQEAITYTAGGTVAAGTTFSALTGNEIYYELSNIRMTLDCVEYSNAYEMMLANTLASSKLVYPIQTWDINVRSIAGNGQTRYTETLSYQYSSINALFFFFTKQTESNTHLYAGKDRIWFPDNAKDFGIRINGQNVPDTRNIDLTGGATECYQMTLSALSLLHTVETYGGLNYDNVVANIMFNSASNADTAITGSYSCGDPYYGKNRDGNYGVPVALTNTGTETTGPENINVAYTVPTTLSAPTPYQREMSPSHFLIGLNLRKETRSNGPGHISGENMSNSSGSIQYELNFSSANNTAWNMHVCVLHNRFIELSSGGANVFT